MQRCVELVQLIKYYKVVDIDMIVCRTFLPVIYSINNKNNLEGIYYFILKLFLGNFDIKID